MRLQLQRIGRALYALPLASRTSSRLLVAIIASGSVWGLFNGPLLAASNVERQSIDSYRPSPIHAATSDWLLAPIMQVSDTGSIAVHSILALNLDPTSAGENLVAVWYIRTDELSCDWYAKTWVNGSVADAIKTVKSELSIDDEWDSAWPIDGDRLVGGAIVTTADYDKGFAANDPLKDIVNQSLNRNALVEALADCGYLIAAFPLEEKNANGEFTIFDSLNSLSSLIDYAMWLSQAQPGPTVPLPTPSPFPTTCPTIPGFPIPTTTTPFPPINPGVLPPGTVSPPVPAPTLFQRACLITPTPNCIVIYGPWGQWYYTNCLLESMQPTADGYQCVYRCTVCRDRAYFEICMNSAGVLYVNDFGIQRRCYDIRILATSASQTFPCPAVLPPPAQAPTGPPPGTAPDETVIPLLPVTPPPPPPPPPPGGG